MARLQRYGSTLATVALILGLASLSAAACFHFPQYLTTPTLREIYPIAAMRGIVQLALVVAFATGLLSFLVARIHRRALIGVGAALLCLVAGAGRTPLPEQVLGNRAIGLDWLLVDGVFVTGIIVLVERFWPRVPGRVRRRGWLVDTVYFVVNHLLAPFFATAMAWLVAHSGIGVWSAAAATVAKWPVWVHVVVMLVLTDALQYGIHRAFHEVPALWKIHAIHHSSNRMDALAGSRTHLVETLVTRGLILIPILALGFPLHSVVIYSGIVVVQATLLHSNLALKWSIVERLIVTPRYHHFHHASEEAAIDRNYAAFFPVFDRLFSTQYLPSDTWPRRYGCVKETIPSDLVGQQLFPWR